jgi:hypothetical protein
MRLFAPMYLPEQHAATRKKVLPPDRLFDDREEAIDHLVDELRPSAQLTVPAILTVVCAPAISYGSDGRRLRARNPLDVVDRIFLDKAFIEARRTELKMMGTTGLAALDRRHSTKLRRSA